MGNRSFRRIMRLLLLLFAPFFNRIEVLLPLFPHFFNLKELSLSEPFFEPDGIRIFSMSLHFFNIMEITIKLFVFF